MSDWTITPEIQADIDRSQRALHGIQTGIAFEMSNGTSGETEPKHLRVGVNSAMSQHTGLVRLLVDKGLITPAEYFKEDADEMERELARYEDRNVGVKFL